MSTKQLLKMVLINIWSNKFRAFLTVLGVIVGSATIVLVVAVGRGGEAQVAEQFSKLNVGTIYVLPASGQKAISPLTLEDAEMINELSAVLFASAFLSGKGDMAYGEISYQGGVVGASPEFQVLNNLKMKEGVFLSDEDERNRSKVTVIGEELAITLFGASTSQVIGESITINNRKYTVVGVMERVGDSTGGVSMDDSAIVPYVVAEKYIFGSSINPRITAVASSLEAVPIAIDDIVRVLDENHQVGGASQFNVRDAGSKLAVAQDTAKTMSVLLIAVAIIVLIVGGIGIMNVMFVTVKERTREIGTLKAIGAKKKEILFQFLLESIIISLAGGVIGVIIGTLVIPVTSYFELTSIPSFSGILLGLVFSLLTGTFFGYYPAYKAAGLNPIEALRYE